MVTESDIHRVDYGCFVRPATETGSGRPRIEPVVGYIIRHRDGLMIFDTGMGKVDAETEAHYRPARRHFAAALRAVGASPEDIRWIVNSHLHFDHCGSNHLVSGRPIVVQAAELTAARRPDYTMPELVDFPGAVYEEIDGEFEVVPGVWVVPTPGHTDGHQSLVVRCADGNVVVAGQAYDFASDYTSDVRAWHRSRDGEGGDPVPYRAWIERLEAFDPARVLFAHDLAILEPRW